MTRLFILIIFFMTLLDVDGQNVGIQTTQPERDLDVRGTAQVKRASNGLNPHLDLIGSDTGDGFSRLKFTSEAGDDDTYWLLAGRTLAGNDAGSKFNVFRKGNTFTGNVITVLGNGKVGLGVSNPVDKLAVSGDVNLTGSIKPNGNAGQPGQMLTVNNSGSMDWIDPCKFQHFRDFSTVGTTNWIVPAGVTEVLVELWGAGGGGAFGGGGGAGAYIKAIMEVSPGQTYTVLVGGGGAGVSGGSTAAGGNGGQTKFTGYGETLTANGGFGATSLLPGSGGSWSVGTTLSSMGRNGGNGKDPIQNIQQVSETGFGFNKHHGDGGKAPFCEDSFGLGEFVINNAGPGFLIKNPGTSGSIPGGGGGGGNWTNNGGGGGYAVIRW